MRTLLFVLILFLLAAAPVEATDLRAHRLAKFFGEYKSPLAFYADDFVHQADRNGIDYRLLPAIAGVESTFGQNYIPGTYNVYGWGRGEIPFTSWPDGIAKVLLSLRQNYFSKGAYRLEDIAQIYDPPGATSWAQGVRFFMNKIDKTTVVVYNF